MQVEFAIPIYVRYEEKVEMTNDWNMRLNDDIVMFDRIMYFFIEFISYHIVRICCALRAVACMHAGYD